MGVWGLIEIAAFAALLIGLTPVVGRYVVAVFTGEGNFLRPALGWLERGSYWLAGIDPKEEMTWGQYTKALLLFNLLGIVVLLALQMGQHFLPLNPQGLPAVGFAVALNTAVSFVTNTNWQVYAGETTMSHGTQMVGLTAQNFLSGATGAGAALVLARGISLKTAVKIGNFWVDLVRGVVYLFLPLSLVMALFLVWQGVPQTLKGSVEITTLEGRQERIPLGPVASQVAIKQLGTNGGGFFNANSAHPFENPTPITNFVELLAITLLPAGFVYAYGLMIGSKRHGWLLFWVIFALWLAGLVVSITAESMGDPFLESATFWEGKESRIGAAGSLAWATSTTATANGSVNAMLSSLSPLAGGVALFNIMLGELLFGGIGVGLSSLLMFVLVTVFLSGLMVGRTPEYRGKKIEKREVQWATLAILGPALLILLGSSISTLIPEGLKGLSSPPPHGLTELLYAFSSTVSNNGSAFSGLKADSNYYAYILSGCMLLGRLTILLPTLAIGGALARKRAVPPSSGTFSTETPLFAILLLCSILIIGALTFFPALSLGPIVEQLLMMKRPL